MTEQHRAHYIGAPEFFELNQACRTIADAFGWGVYLVGSSTRTREYRDVDVRCILDDEEFDVLFPASSGDWFRDARWSLLSCSISTWLAQRTGLKIDFQFQRRTEANAEFAGPEHSRNALGIFFERKAPVSPVESPVK